MCEPERIAESMMDMDNSTILEFIESEDLRLAKIIEEWQISIMKADKKSKSMSDQNCGCSGDVLALTLKLISALYRR